MKNWMCPKCGKQKLLVKFAPLCRECRCAFVEKTYDLDMLCFELLNELDKTQSQNERMIILRRFVGNAYVTAKEMGADKNNEIRNS